MRPGEFINILKRTRKRMLTVAEAILLNPIVAEEIVEEAVIYWTEHIDKLPSHIPDARSYLVKTTKDRAHNKRRNLLTEKDTRVMATIASQLLASTPGADTLVEEAEEAYSEEILVMRVEAAMNHLSPQQRALAWRVWFHGQKLPDAAKEMGLQRHTAYRALVRARVKVRKLVKGGK